MRVVLLFLSLLLAVPAHAGALGDSFRDELKAKEQATGLSLLVDGVSWNQHNPNKGLDPLPASLSQAQKDAIAQVVAAHVYVAPSAVPDIAGFKAWLKANMSFALRNSVTKAYPNFAYDLDNRAWADFQVGCILAKTDVPITNGQWTAFKGAVTTYKIPVTLP